jgi:signal transduction histidine kinase/FixJ family two-component response regulator
MSRPLRVLIIDDSTADALLLVNELRQNAYEPEFEIVDTAEEMSAALEMHDWDLVIADYVLPQFDGLAALELLERKKLDLPFILVSGRIGEDVAVRAMRAGAHDFISKDNLARLAPALERELREAEVRRARREADEALRQAHAELEVRVKERTAELEEANAKLLEEIAERERVEEALRESVAKYSTLFTSIDEGFCIIEVLFDESEKPIDYRFLEVNPSFERQTGIQNAEGRWMREIAPQHEEHWFEIYGKIALTGEPARFENRAAQLGRYYDVFAFRVGDPVERKVAILFNEISARKQAEVERERLTALVRDMNSQLVTTSLHAHEAAEKAAERAAELDATFAAMADAVVICGPEGRIVRMNPAAERLLSFTPEERSLPMAERGRLMQPEKTDGTSFPLDELPTWQALRWGKASYGVILVIRNPRTHAKTWVSNSSAPVRSEDGRLLGAVTIFSDITMMHELQEQREDILRTVSHDLRNPLGIVLGQAQLIDRFADQPDKVRQSAGSVVTSARRMNAIIQDLVESTRLASGQLKLDLHPVDLHALIVDLLERAAVSMDVRRVNVRIPSTIPSVWGDGDRIDRILTNLISNALKYSSPDSRVLVEGKAIDGEVIISVSDKGVGIAPKDLPSIFERYYQPEVIHKARGLGPGALYY